MVCKKCQLLITVGENGLRIQRWEGCEGLEFVVFLGFKFHISFFFSPLSKQVSQLRGNLFKILISHYLYFFFFVICVPSLPSERVQILLQCISKCWEMVLFLAKYVVLGSARPHECFKAADAGFPPSHRKACRSFSSTTFLPSPGGSEAAKP